MILSYQRKLVSSLSFILDATSLNFLKLLAKLTEKICVWHDKSQIIGEK